MNFLIRSAARRLMFQPPPRLPGSKLRLDSKNVLVQSMTGDQIHCHLTCPFDLDTTLHDYTGTSSLVIFMHGNADDVSSSKAYCQWLSDHLQLNVLSFDYPGYGFSSGVDNASEEGMADAAVAVLEYASFKLKHELCDVILIGKSIGSYPAVCTAAQPYCATLGGLLLISPIASAARCVVERKVVPDFVMRRLDTVALSNMSHIGNVQCLMLLVHGVHDDLVSIDNSHDLLAAAHSASTCPPLWVEAGHNDVESRHTSLFLATVCEFVKECQKRRDGLAARSPYEELVSM